MRKAKQREFGFVNWGGKRRGAGRKACGERAGVSHGKRPALKGRFPVLVTMRLRAGLPSLRYGDSHAVVRSALVRATSDGFRVVEYSVQSNHLHLVAESSSERSLARGMIGLSVRIARGLNKSWRRIGPVFPDRYHARILRTPKAVRIALVYVLQNARKHDAWRARRPDVYSSGPMFEGWKAQDRMVAQSSSRWLARAGTWLLSTGWRKHGLLDPQEHPKPQRARLARIH